MGLISLKPGASKSLTQLLNDRDWVKLLDAVRNGAPAHARLTDSPLTLFEGVLKAMAAYARSPHLLAPQDRQERAQQLELFRALAAVPWVHDPRRPTPMTSVCLMGRLDLVEILLRAGHGPDDIGEGFNPATGVAQIFLPPKATLSTLEALEESGFDTDSLNRRNCLKRLIRAGLDVGAPAFQGATALHMACAAKDTGLVLFLLAQGVAADVPSEASGVLGWAPLEIAARLGSETVFLALLKSGADPLRSAASSPGLSIAAVACKFGHPGMLQALREALGGSDHPAFQQGWLEALRQDNGESIGWFLKAGYSPNAPLLNRRLPLHVAIEEGGPEGVHRLGAAGAALNQVDDRGITAAQLLHKRPDLAIWVELPSKPSSCSTVVPFPIRSRP